MDMLLPYRVILAGGSRLDRAASRTGGMSPGRLLLRRRDLIPMLAIDTESLERRNDE